MAKIHTKLELTKSEATDSLMLSKFNKLIKIFTFNQKESDCYLEYQQNFDWLGDLFHCTVTKDGLIAYQIIKGVVSSKPILTF